MKRSISVITVLFYFTIAVVAQSSRVQSPAQFLGYELGDQFTPHYKVVNYFQHVADNSDLVSYQDYGKTYEGRELTYAVVTSANNHANLEEIRTNNLRLVGFENGDATENKKPIVWLSYNVHGNEASSSEAAMNTLYTLITEKRNWLDDIVIIMDPMVNPDGRDRYVYWNKSVTGSEYNPLVEAREHQEPWPGGRTNHYYFDLNRDWSWQTQVESQQRIPVYQSWMPHVHVDFHEQGINSPYFFPPAAIPQHEAITKWQSEYQEIVGKNNASYFDKNNWLYFTGEVFDLFYPSYGDTWPIFNGAIGMTYEQAGHSMGGLGVINAEGDTLTLKDRLTHHTTTGLSTIEATIENGTRVVDEFAKYFDEARNNGSGEYKSFVIKKSSNPDKIAMLLRHMLSQNIEFGVATKSSKQNGYNYANGKEERVDIEAGDYVISTYQPQGTMVRVLFEPKPFLEDSLTYDLTSWETFYNFGVKGYAIKGNIGYDAVQDETISSTTPYISKPYAYLAKWNSLDDLKFLSKIMKRKVNVRYSQSEFTLDGQKYDSGTLIITRKGNEKLGDDFDEIVKSAADDFNRDLIPVASGYVESGKDFGSSSVRFVTAPKVALLSGDNTNADMVGHIWHYFDQQIEYPVTLLNTDRLARVDLSKFDVLVMASGNYNSVFGDSALDELKAWIRKGGTLIALESANNFLANKPGFSLKTKAFDNNKNEDDTDSRLVKFSEARRGYAENSNAGAIYKLDMDNTHPLAFGYDDDYMSLKLGSTAYEYLENGWNVGVAKKDSHRSGFVGHKAQKRIEESLSFGVQNMGQGSVVYMIDNPIFRGFWHNGKLLFGNALFFVGN